MITLVMIVSTVTTAALVVAALLLAAWSFRRFDVSIFIWLILSRVCSAVAWAMVTIPSPKNSQKALEHLQEQMKTGVSEAIHTMWIAPMTLALFSTLLLLLVAAAELGHIGPKLVAGYEPHPLLRRAYRCRFIIGMAAVLCAIGPSLFLSYVMRTGL